ncbi:hypothetical protein STEG23_015016 [Scotinomys teguina]
MLDSGLAPPAGTVKGLERPEKVSSYHPNPDLLGNWRVALTADSGHLEAKQSALGRDRRPLANSQCQFAVCSELTQKHCQPGNTKSSRWMSPVSSTQCPGNRSVLPPEDSCLSTHIKSKDILKRPPDEQRLYKDDQLLDDGKTLGEYGFTSQTARPQAAATVGLAFQVDDAFEPLRIEPFSSPPELPDVMKPQDSGGSANEQAVQ